MTEQNDISTGKIFLVGSLGVIVTVAVTLVAIISYFSVDARVARSRSNEAAVRIGRETEAIAAGHPVYQPWLDPDLQRATQQAQLNRYERREIAEENGPQRIVYSIPIEQAMESVLQEAEASRSAQPKNEGATQ
jgi:hypothetical protein